MLLDNDIRDFFVAQGLGYKTWADAVILSTKMVEDSMSVIDAVKE